MLRLIFNSRIWPEENSGGIVTTFKTFDVELPEIERFLRKVDAYPRPDDCAIVGIELIRTPKDGDNSGNFTERT